jgi:predicted membrane protein
VSGTARQAAVVIGITAIAAGAAHALRFRIGDPAWRGAIAGAVLAGAGAVAGTILADWAFERDRTRFFAALGAGMIGRLVLYCGALLVAALRWADRIDTIAMAGALLGLYVVFQVLEVRHAVRRLRERKG